MQISGAEMRDRWLLRTIRPSPRVRLFCFHHAGGSVALFRQWPGSLPADVEVCAVQLPGHSTRLDERPLADVEGIVAALLPVVTGLGDLPSIFFGHSFGALLANELAHALVRVGRRSPAHLVVSARRAPTAPDPLPPMHGLSDEAFLDEIDRRYGGIPREVRAHADVMALLLPGLRADVHALETFVAPVRGSLECPLTVFGGEGDVLTTRRQLEGWACETRGRFRLRMFSGGHFYLDAHREEVLRELVPILASAADGSMRRS